MGSLLRLLWDLASFNRLFLMEVLVVLHLRLHSLLLCNKGGGIRRLLQVALEMLALQ